MQYSFSKLMLVLFLLIHSFNAFAWQESHGGDEDALEFVKIGKVIGSELQNHPEMDEYADAFLQQVNNSFVSMARYADEHLIVMPDGRLQQSPLSRDNHAIVSIFNRNILVNRGRWRSASCSAKVKHVFNSYSSLITKKIKYPLFKKLKAHLYNRVCTKLSEFDLAFTGQINVNSPKDEFIAIHNNLISFLKNSNNNPYFDLLLTKISSIDVDKIIVQFKHNRSYHRNLKDKLILTQGGSTANLCHATDDFYSHVLGVSQKSIDTERNYYCKSLHRGKNYEEIKIIFSKDWKNLKPHQKVELLFHEYLGLFTTSDLFYRASSELFLN